MIFFEWISSWLKYGLTRLWGALPLPVVSNWIASSGITDRGSYKADSEEWKTNAALREYHLGDADETRVTVQTSTHAFHVSKNNTILPTVKVKLNLTCCSLQKLWFNNSFLRNS